MRSLRPAFCLILILSLVFTCAFAEGTEDASSFQHRLSQVNADVRLPEFRILAPGATPAQILECVYDYVDPTRADMGEKAVEMYYGDRLLTWYASRAAQGTADAAQSEARTAAAQSPAALYDPSGLKNRAFATMMAARMALSEPFKPYLAAMGAEEPAWTYEDVDALYGALFTGLDEMITAPAVFSRETDALLVRSALGSGALGLILSLAHPQDDRPGDYDFRLPAGTVEIEESAFEGIAATSVYIPDSCQSIGSAAFRGCTGLRVVRVPAACAIADDAFDGCANLTLVSVTGSTAEAFAAAHPGVSFETDDTVGE